MCLVIDSGILVANTFYYSQTPCIEYNEIRKYSDLLLKEMKSIPIIFTDDIGDPYFSVGKFEFIKMSDQILISKFNREEYWIYLNRVFPKKTINFMMSAGEKYLQLQE